MAGSSNSGSWQTQRRVLVAAGLALASAWALAQATLDQRILEIREQSRFVPDKALVQLQIPQWRSGDMPPMCRTCSLVHNPPPAHEDPDAILGGPDVSAWYAGRDLAPLGGEDSDPALFERLRAAGVLGWVDELSTHARDLERRASRQPWNRVRQFLRRATGRAR